MRLAVLLALLLIASATLSGCTQAADPAEGDAADVVSGLGDPAGTPSSDVSSDTTSDPSSNTTTLESPTEAGEEFTPLYDILLEGTYVPAPANLEPLLSYTFDVAKKYDTLEVNGRYNDVEGDYAAVLNITVTGPDGRTLIFYDHVDARADLIVQRVGTGGSLISFPLGFHWDPEPGTYQIDVRGAGSPLDLTVIGSAGMAPDFQFRLLDSETTKNLTDYNGNITLVDLMATWCGPCNDAMPDLVDLKEEYGPLITVLSVDVDETETDEELASFQEKHGAGWTFGFELEDSATQNYGTGFIPTFAILDQRGGLLYRQIGAMDPQKARDIIDYALANR